MSIQNRQNGQEEDGIRDDGLTDPLLTPSGPTQDDHQFAPASTPVDPTATEDLVFRELMEAFFLPPKPTEDLSVPSASSETRTASAEEEITREEEQDQQNVSENCLYTILHFMAVRTDSCLQLNNIDFARNGILLVLSAVMFQISFLWWGYAQESIMTTKFEPTQHSPTGHFPSATFCVWINRSMALVVSGTIVSWKYFYGRPCDCNITTPTWPFPHLQSYSPCAVSNALSSWCQYAALKYVSFPVHAMFRSCKIVVTMLVGNLLHKTRYSWIDYTEAVLISTGVLGFAVTSRESYPLGSYSSWLGFLLLAAYLFCDAFTNQWQEKIYQTYGRRNVDPIQMMLGVNLFGWLITSLGLLASNDISIIVEFLQRNPICVQFLWSAALASSLGQLVIFFIIREFGPVIFTIMSTIRQLFAVLLSDALFKHALPASSVMSGLFVFCVICFQIRRNYVLARQPEVLVAA